MPTKRIKRYYPEIQWGPAGYQRVVMTEADEDDKATLYVLAADYSALEERVLALMTDCNHTFEVMPKDHSGTQRCTKCGIITDLLCEHYWVSTDDEGGAVCLNCKKEIG